MITKCILYPNLILNSKPMPGFSTRGLGGSRVEGLGGCLKRVILNKEVA